MLLGKWLPIENAAKYETGSRHRNNAAMVREQLLKHTPCIVCP